MNITRSLYDTTIDGDLEAIRRLISEIGQWPALFPHIQEVTLLRDNRWQVRSSWYWMPVSVVVAQRLMGDPVTIEQRMGTRSGLRIACYWTLWETPADQTQVRLQVELCRGPVLLRDLVLRTVVRSKAQQALDQIRLLAEADRKAHQNIV